MNRSHVSVYAIATLVLAASAALAHPGGHHASDAATTRPEATDDVWTNAVTGERVHGSYLTADDLTLHLELDGGGVVAVPLAELVPGDRARAESRRGRIRELNAAPRAGVSAQPTSRPAAAVPFTYFPGRVAVRWDAQYLYVESDGMPEHRMMVGIRAWQQQVPLPQAYRGENAWRIPLFPVPAARPMSGKDNFFRGAIALAANGVPIFNPIKNDGRTDTFLAGELDEFGGHAGRADDYHYHVAPLHLQKVLGADLPVAYALDGYPIYGLLGGKACPLAGDVPLDGLNGHAALGGAPGVGYHYHASKTYPYINGGTFGVVAVREGQISPQPRARPRREATSPLRGATVSGFTSPAARTWELTYMLRGVEYTVRYLLNPDDTATFSTTPPPPRSNNERPPQEERPPRAGDPPTRGEGRAPGPTSRPRKPWILVHALEMDADRDGSLTRGELVAEVRRTFTGYDKDADGVVTKDETARPLRTPLGGFVQQHFAELAGDVAFTRAQLQSAVERMFDRADADGDGVLSPTEIGAGETPATRPLER